MREIWGPAQLASDRPAYVALADAIARDLARGDLMPGDRLPTHRALAAKLGVTVRTVARGYAEAERRGLVAGQVGRGTYVRSAFGLAPRRPTALDLSSLHPPIAGGPAPSELLQDTLRALAADPISLAMVTDTEHSADHPAHRTAAAAWVTHAGFTPSAEGVLLTAGAQHALALCLLALVPRGSTVATTPLTNPGLLAAARALSVRVVAVECDADGMTPGALAEVCSKQPVAAVHLQPTFGNPRGQTMSAARREALVEAARRADCWIIEDDPLAALAPERPGPIAALAPDRTCYLTSAAKVLALGLRIGILVAPASAGPQLSAALRASTWLTPPLLGEVLARWLRDGVAEQIVRRRIEAAHERGHLAREALEHLDVRGDVGSPHLWIELPSRWSAGSFAAAVRDHHVMVAPGDDFAVDRASRTDGVRIGLNAELNDEELRRALGIIAHTVPLGPSTR